MKRAMDNEKFARELLAAKEGVISTSKSKTDSRPKSIKQSRAATKTSAEEDSKSSTAGADGDDDFSAADSPSLSATNMPAPRSGDVSDMLEPARPGPAILRIGESTKPAQPKREKQPPKIEATLTKKQRQNKKKAEEAKEQRQLDEKIRKELEEKQRRTAREAEGRAAKDGSTFMASQAPKDSAWTAPAATTNGHKSSAGKDAPLLDTYEPTQNGTSKVLPPKELAGTKANSDWEVVPKEILSEDSEWNTVKTKKPAKKPKKAGESPEVSAAENAPAPIPKKPAAVKQTTSFLALKDEGANLKDEDAAGVWEEKKGFIKATVADTNVRQPTIHTFTIVKKDGTTELITSHQAGAEQEWEV